jgi:hypothetical protein
LSRWPIVDSTTETMLDSREVSAHGPPVNVDAVRRQSSGLVTRQI